MNILILCLIYCGSALILLSIIQYYRFFMHIRQARRLAGSNGLLTAPFALLVLFFFGYLGVGLFGRPDILMAAILFGGSLFVQLVLRMIISVIKRLIGNEDRANLLYEEMKNSLDQVTKDSLSVFHVNLTRDIIEDRGGTDLYDEDLTAQTYTQMLSGRFKYLMIKPDFSAGPGLFTREGLLAHFAGGHAEASEVLFSRRKSGHIGFIIMSASMTQQPGTGDIIALITERSYNSEIVNDTILNKALAQQYDMISYIVQGQYGVVVGSRDTARRGSIFPSQPVGAYEDYISRQILPVLHGTAEEKTAAARALSLETVEEALKTDEPYEVQLSVDVDGELFFKHFCFFLVDPAARFYILLKSDTTQVQREQIRKNIQLEEALENAEEASAAKTIFLSNMSHDIRTPMNAIIGFTDLARSSQDTDEIRDYLGKIRSSCNHLLSLINDVLEMSRIESGKMELRETEEDLCQIMYEAREMFSLQMADKHLDYTVSAKPLKNRYAYLDRSRFNRILFNLISNALKFTPEGGSVFVSLSQETAEGAYTLRVKDTGIGMTAAFAEKVFDAFERERSSTVSGIQGTGLGMAITKRIVDNMGGSIEVITAPDEGTEFIVRLPLKTSDRTADPDTCPCQLGQEPAAEATADFEGKRILVVDDILINREVAKLMLVQMGFTVDMAENGRQAADMIAEHDANTWQAVLMDIQMPVMNGYEATKAIRSLPDPAKAQLPVIAMSANAFAEDVQACLDAGMDGHVAKPVDTQVLKRTLEEILAKDPLSV